MEILEFLQYRTAFTGLPFGELQTILKQVTEGEPWGPACRAAAGRLRRLAERAQSSGREVSAAEAWRWAASAYHAATFGLHLDPNGHGRLDEVLELRRLARTHYLQALRADPSLASPIEINAAGAVINGYLRLPSKRPAPVVVLLNGLDSLCEVEMHVFGTWLLSRGMAVVALDIPCSFAQRPRTPRLDVENLASPLADWITESPQLEPGGIGAFGVSFGGYLVARLLAGDRRFTAGAAVSPPAWIAPRELALKRVRLMFACAFDLHSDREIDAMASRVLVPRLPTPGGSLLIFHMEQDQVFGPEHADAYRKWGGSHVEMRTLCAEHVGTSQIHNWLPEVCDWLSLHLFRRKGDHRDSSDFHTYHNVHRSDLGAVTT